MEAFTDEQLTQLGQDVSVRLDRMEGTRKKFKSSQKPSHNGLYREVCSTWTINNPVKLGGPGIDVEMDESSLRGQISQRSTT